MKEALIWIGMLGYAAAFGLGYEAREHMDVDRRLQAVELKVSAIEHRLEPIEDAMAPAVDGGQ